MSVLAFPQATSGVPNPSSMRTTWLPHPMVFISETTGARQRLHQWGMWTMQLTWGLLGPSESNKVIAFIHRHIDTGYFTIYDPARTISAGTARGPKTSPVGLVKGASQAGRTLLTDGWAINQASLFLPGDLIQTASVGEVYEVAAQVASDGSGNATIPITNRIRTSPADNEPLVAEFCEFRMEVQEFEAPQTTKPILRSVSVTLAEHLSIA